MTHFPSPPPGQFTFDVLGELGTGGFGVVEKIKITSSAAPALPVGSEWARKRLNPAWDQNPTARARFEREITALQQMSHDNIVGCFGTNLAGKPRFYVMPLYQSSFRKMIHSNVGRGDWRYAARIGAILAAAMGYAHGAGFIHRDIKPENILFNPNEPPIIADWGLGYFVHRHSKVLKQLTRGGMGTEYYCSLEQWNTGKCDERGDIYSLGMTLDELVTGTQRRITVGAGVRTPTVHGGGPDADRFNALLQSMTHPAPSGRPSSMWSVSMELNSILTPQLPYLG